VAARKSGAQEDYILRKVALERKRNRGNEGRVADGWEFVVLSRERDFWGMALIVREEEE
jgi:hypothetical protein